MERQSKKITLVEPVEAHGQQVHELEIHEPAAREFEAMDRGSGRIQQAHHLLAACARIPYSSILSLCAKDYQAAMEALGELGFSQAPEPQSEPEG